jgi:glycosyltransferase involved in cell wall biosynthesis
MDIVYLTHNRLEYTQKTFPAMLACVREGKDRLWVVDDGSTDGTWEYVKQTINEFPFKHQCRPRRGKFGNPNGALNLMLKESAEKDSLLEVGLPLSSLIAKVDNDYLLKDPNIFAFCEEVFVKSNGSAPPLGIFGFVANAHGDAGKVARWVGGNYVARRAVFHKPVPVGGQFFGWTNYQIQLADKWEIRWSDKHLAISIDDLPENLPLRHLYAAKGWSRLRI